MAFGDFVQHKTNNTGTSPAAAAFDTNNVAGNILFCCVLTNPAATNWTIADTQSNAWTILTSSSATNVNEREQWAVCLSAKAGANTVTVTAAGISYVFPHIFEMDCQGFTAIVDGSNHAAVTGTSLSVSLTTTHTNCLLMTGSRCSTGPTFANAAAITGTAGVAPIDSVVTFPSAFCFCSAVQAAAGAYGMTETAASGDLLANIVAIAGLASGISNLAYTVTDTTIVANWNTGTATDSNLTAGAKAAIDNGVAANSLVHQCIVTGLIPNTSYACFVTSGGTSSSTTNVKTNPAQNRVLASSVSFGTTITTQSTLFGDTFYNFLSNDNKVYCTEDDGQGFIAGGPNAGANVQLGVLTSETALTGTLVNLLTAYGGSGTTNGTDGPAGGALSNKGAGLFGMLGNLYMSMERQAYPSIYGVGPTQVFFPNIIKSTDKGASWNNWQTPLTFNAAGTPPTQGTREYGLDTWGWTSFVIYGSDDGTMGYNTAGNQIDGANGFVYMTANAQYWDDDSNIYLMRIPRIQFDAQNASAFQYWVGPASPSPADFVNDSNWSSSTSGVTAIYSVANQSSSSHLVFVPTINSYLFITWYQPIVDTGSNDSIWVISAGPTPAGPWTNISKHEWTPAGYYNPTVLHRNLTSNVLSTAIPLRVYYSGDYNNVVAYYHPTTSTTVVNTVPAWKPLSVAHFVTGGTTSSVSSITSANFASTTGNLLVVGVRVGTTAADITSVKNAAGVSFTQIANSISPRAGSAQTTLLYYLPNITGNATDNVVVAFGTPLAFTSVCVWEIAGADPSNPLSAATMGFSDTNVTTITSGAFISGSPHEIICAAGGISAINSTFTTSLDTLDSAGFPAGAGALYSAAAHSIVSGINTGLTASITGNVTHPASISVATFMAAPATVYSIAGSAGTPGATVSYSGAASGSVVADASGNFSIPNLLPGSYTITPSLSGYTFLPVNSAQTVTSANITGVNFTATQVPAGGDSQRFDFEFQF